MRRFDVTYRYENPKAAVVYVIATMGLWVSQHVNLSEVVSSIERADGNLRVIGVEAA